MDFSLTEEQRVLGEAARTVLADRCTHERLKALEAESETVFDRELWRLLAEAGILAAVVPEEHGGSGLGLLDLLDVLEAVGHHVAPVPVVPTLVLGVLPLAAFGSPDQQAAWLPGVAAGEVVLTAAIEEAGNDDLASPVVRAEPDGPAWRLDGTKHTVPYGEHARQAIVSATTPDGPALVLADPSDERVTVVPQVPTNRQPAADLEFDGAPAELLAQGSDAVAWLAERGAAAVCAVQAGVCEGALRLTAAYTASRHQFGKPIAEFQAVAQRAADAFVDTEMVRLTAWQALYRLGAGLEATREVHTAKFWAGDGGMRVVHAAQHLHGGIGVDLDYPLHRYFVWAKQNEHTLGTPTRELIRLGAALADDPARPT